MMVSWKQFLLSGIDTDVSNREQITIDRFPFPDKFTLSISLIQVAFSISYSNERLTEKSPDGV